MVFKINEFHWMKYKSIKLHGFYDPFWCLPAVDSWHLSNDHRTSTARPLCFICCSTSKIFARTCKESNNYIMHNVLHNTYILVLALPEHEDIYLKNKCMDENRKATYSCKLQQNSLLIWKTLTFIFLKVLIKFVSIWKML